MRHLSAVAAAIAVLGAASASAQHGRVPDQDPVRVKYAGSRQYRGEPKGNEAKRGTRCTIVVRQGQDKRVCGVPTGRAPRK